MNQMASVMQQGVLYTEDNDTNTDNGNNVLVKLALAKAAWDTGMNPSLQTHKHTHSGQLLTLYTVAKEANNQNQSFQDITPPKVKIIPCQSFPVHQTLPEWKWQK